MAIPANFAQNVRVYSGNRITLEVANQEIGLAQSLQAADSYGLQPASGIGNINVIEYVPSLATHEVTLSAVLLYPSALANVASIQDFDNGHAFENGKAALRGLTCDIVLRGRSIEGIDNPQGADRVIRKYVGCSYDSGTISVEKHAIVIYNARFRALDVFNDDSASAA